MCSWILKTFETRWTTTLEFIQGGGPSQEKIPGIHNRDDYWQRLKKNTTSTLLKGDGNATE